MTKTALNSGAFLYQSLPTLLDFLGSQSGELTPLGRRRQNSTFY
jgi:hypothetical protein